MFICILICWSISHVALMVKNPPANARDIKDAGLIPGSGRSPGGGHGNPFQYSCLEIPWKTEPGMLQSMGSKESDMTEWLMLSCSSTGFPGSASSKEPACQCRRCKRHRFDPWVRKIPWRRAWLPTPVFLPGESHGWRRLVGYSPWGHKESDTYVVIQAFSLWRGRHK